ncbi:hypothetical protein BBR47_33450 [Brevibacillus brevis NBRC 100599]|uniref:Uncharacterized protein n=1 Tax=Brevibacillus brevis (strain 47 / JCM 6285 / NBRC 100599) TaxID=358681 RepID=C0ZEW3_BREBN|nr:hypothetical protein BBR47_33450 [Brevibacillus brevis NBRC 100599]
MPITLNTFRSMSDKAKVTTPKKQERLFVLYANKTGTRK